MYLNITVYTPVGTFVGTSQPTSAAVEELTKFRDSIQKKVDLVTYLVLFVDNAEVLIPGDVLRSSVTEFRIQAAPAFNKPRPV